MLNLRKSIYFFLAAAMLCACAEELEPQTESPAEMVPIALSSRIDQEYTTRADQYGFADGDVIATYIVDYENGAPGQLKTSGNRADNLYYTYNEPGFRWVPAYDVYYKDDKTKKELITSFEKCHSILEKILLRLYIWTKNTKMLHLTIRLYKANDK